MMSANKNRLPGLGTVGLTGGAAVHSVSVKAWCN